MCKQGDVESDVQAEPGANGSKAQVEAMCKRSNARGSDVQGEQCLAGLEKKVEAKWSDSRVFWQELK